MAKAAEEHLRVAAYWNNAMEADRIQHLSAIGCPQSYKGLRFQSLLSHLTRTDRKELKSNILNEIEFGWKPIE